MRSDRTRKRPCNGIGEGVMLFMVCASERELLLEVSPLLASMPCRR